MKKVTTHYDQFDVYEVPDYLKTDDEIMDYIFSHDIEPKNQDSRNWNVEWIEPQNKRENNDKS
jgi:hypothetical protein